MNREKRILLITCICVLVALCGFPPAGYGGSIQGSGGSMDKNTKDILEYMKMPSIGGHQPYIDLSKDGKFVLFNSNDTGKPNLYVQAVENPSDIRRITVAEKMVYVGKFSPDGKTVVFPLEAHGSETSDLFLVRLDSPDKPPQKITRKACMTYAQGIGWHPTGTEVMRTFTDGDNSGIEIIDMKTLTPEILVDGVPPLMSARYSFDGKWIACTAYDSNSSIFLVNRTKPEETKTIKLSKTCFNASPSWSFDDKNIGFITNINGFFQPVVYNLENDTYYFIDLSEGEESVAHSQIAQEIEFHPGGDHIYYNVNKTGRKYIKEYSISTKKSTVIPFPKGTIDSFELNPTAEIIVAIHSSMKSPKKIFKYDLKTKKVALVTNNPNQEKLDALPAPESVYVESFDGRKIHSWYIPANRKEGKPGPALVVPHGGPSQNTSDEWFEGLYYQAFVLAGFSVIVPNYRGSTGYGDDFFKQNVGDVGGGDLDDVIAAANWIKNQKGVDPSKVAIMGASYGGYLTIMAMGKHPDVFNAGVSLVPAVDWAYQYGVSDEKFKNYIKYLLAGTPEEKKDLYEKRSALYHAGSITRPMLVIAGANDYRCPVKPIKDLEEILKKNKVEHKFVFKGADGHMSLFDDKQEQIKDLFTMIEFLKEQLY